MLLRNLETAQRTLVRKCSRASWSEAHSLCSTWTGLSTPTRSSSWSAPRGRGEDSPAGRGLMPRLLLPEAKQMPLISPQAGTEGLLLLHPGFPAQASSAALLLSFGVSFSCHSHPSLTGLPTANLLTHHIRPSEREAISIACGRTSPRCAVLMKRLSTPSSTWTIVALRFQQEHQSQPVLRNAGSAGEPHFTVQC